MKEVVLYRGTTYKEATDSRENNFKDLSWWTDSIGDLKDFDKGAIMKIKILIEDNIKMDFIHEIVAFEEFNENYTFGYIDFSFININATWYSFSKKYIITHYKELEVKNLEEILSGK